MPNESPERRRTDRGSRSDRIRVHLWIRGVVQGVGYRMSCASAARREGLRGWVRNLEDGQVEAVMQGSRDAVERVVEWCRRGPPGAVVEEVRVEPEPPADDLPEFRITH